MTEISFELRMETISMLMIFAVISDRSVFQLLVRKGWERVNFNLSTISVS